MLVSVLTLGLIVTAAGVGALSLRFTDKSPQSSPDDLTGEMSYSSSGDGTDTTTTPDPMSITTNSAPLEIPVSFGIWTELRSPNGHVWSQNYPTFREQFYVASYKRNIADKSSKLLLAGGLSHKSPVRDTWIYTPWTNSWLELSTGPQLPPTHAWGHPVLPTLCDTFVVLIVSVEDVWVFDGRTEMWAPLSVNPDSEQYISSTIEGAVALQSSSCTPTSCNCSGSIILYGFSSKDLLSLQLYELQCVSSHNGSLECTWAREPKFVQFISQKCQLDLLKNVKAHGLMAVADQETKIIYFTRRCLILDDTITKNVTIFSYAYYSGNVTLDSLRFHIRKPVCFTNVFLWKDSEAMFVDIFYTFAMTTKNHSRFQLFKTKPRNTYINNDVILKMPSGPIQLTWFLESKNWKPNIYIYHTSSTSSEGFPIFYPRKKHFPPLLYPGTLRHHTAVYDDHSQTFYLYGGRPGNGVSPTGNLWALPVTVSSKTWWLIRPHPRPGAYMSNCGTYSQSKIILFGGQYGNETVGDELWLYNTNFRTWMTPARSGDREDTWPRPRAGCSLTSSSEDSTVILFGGYSNNKRAMSDIWILQIGSNGTTATWTNVTPTTVAETGSITTPSPRFGHSSVMVDNELIIYGGSSKLSDIEYSCLFDMWGFDISNRTWRMIVSLPREQGLDLQAFADSSGINGSCDTFLVRYGESRVVAGRSLVLGESTVGASNSIWIIDISSLTTSDIRSPNISVLVQAAGISRGSLVLYGRYSTHARLQETGLLSVGGTCKPGLARIYGPAELCMPCPIGQYSKIRLSVHQCVECPRGTTTMDISTTSIEGCTCDAKYCVHGSCQESRKGDVVSVVCKCSFGFVGEQCNRVDYVVFIMSFAFLIVVSVVTTTLAWCGIRTARHHRARKQTEWELKETRKAFTIMPWEVKLLCRLDENCPGGYGQVHKATYRDWTVAVKQLHLDMAEWADIRNEFLREIHFMRTVRHPNIVMFIGAGQYREKQPFLVLEFMSGGALRSLLQNSDEELTRKNKLQFILDIAEGMQHLHTLQPPRIHRDLKSANLLLSGTRRVKVADFGCARLIPQIDRESTTNKPNPKNSSVQSEESQELLDESVRLTSRFIGTARWRSPELWQRKPYGTATDVYR